MECRINATGTSVPVLSLQREEKEKKCKTNQLFDDGTHSVQIWEKLWLSSSSTVWRQCSTWASITICGSAGQLLKGYTWASFSSFTRFLPNYENHGQDKTVQQTLMRTAYVLEDSLPSLKNYNEQQYLIKEPEWRPEKLQTVFEPAGLDWSRDRTSSCLLKSRRFEDDSKLCIANLFPACNWEERKANQNYSCSIYEVEFPPS